MVVVLLLLAAVATWERCVPNFPLSSRCNGNSYNFSGLLSGLVWPCLLVVPALLAERVGMPVNLAAQKALRRTSTGTSNRSRHSGQFEQVGYTPLKPLDGPAMQLCLY